MEENIEYIESEEKNAENEPGQAGDDSNDVVGEKGRALALREQVREEWRLPIEKRALLVRSFGTVTVQMIDLATEVARRYGLPISGVNIIPSKAGLQPYVNSDGIRWRLHTDEREFKSSSGMITHMPTADEKWISAYAKVELQNGAWADNESFKEWPITDTHDKDRSFNLGNMCKKLITQAKRRAGADLVGVGLPIYDEYYDNKEAIEGEYTVVEEKPKKTEPTTLNELIVMAGQVDESLDVDVLIKMMDVNVMDDLRDIVKETWDKIQEEYKVDAEN